MTFGVTSRPDVDVTVQTSVTYQVSTKQGRIYLSSYITSLFPGKKVFVNIAKCLCRGISQEVAMDAPLQLSSSVS